MAKVSQIFNKLVEERKISIKTGDKKSHDALRIRLVKLFTRHKTMLDSLGASDDSSTLSLSAEYQDSKGISQYFIRPAKKFGAEEKVDFEILDEESPDALAT